LPLRAASLVILGLVLNHFNISVLGMIQKNQQIYYPSPGECGGRGITGYQLIHVRHSRTGRRWREQKTKPQ